VSRAKRLIKAASEYIPDAIETPLLKAFGVELSRAPRPRQKPKLRTDNPGGEWLENQRRRADETLDRNRLKVSGATTGYLKNRIELDPRKLAVIPGASGERRVPGDPQYDNLRPLVEREGLHSDSPILVGINHRGEPYIIEGNTRTAVARDLGLRSVPAEVRYFAGGEGVEGPMMPSRLEEYMPPSELSLDPNFQRFFGGSKAVDEYGEPQRFYHGTLAPSGIDAFRFNSHFGTASQANERLKSLSELHDDYRHLYPSKAREAPQVMPVYLNAQNPMRVEDTMLENWRKQIEEAKSLGHDSIVYLNRGEMTADQLDEIFDMERSRNAKISDDELRKGVPGVADSYIVFDPKQIKSAIGNRGTYDPDDPDINMARGGLAVKPNKFAVKRKSKTRNTNR
jgi:hypothetical protein